MADPSLRRPLRRVPVRRSRGGGRRGGAVFGHALRRRRRILEPPRGDLYLRCDGGGVRPCNRAAPPPRGDRARGGHWPYGRRTAGRRSARRLAGLSRMYADDLAQLEAGMTLYDAFYRWFR